MEAQMTDKTNELKQIAKETALLKAELDKE